MPSGIHPVFHVELLRPAADDPLPSQVVDDSQPPPIVVDGEPEWQIEEILAARTKKVGRGERRQVLVKWLGYARLSWHDLELFKDCDALDVFEKRFGYAMVNDGPRERYEKGSRTTQEPTRRRRVRTGPSHLRIEGVEYCDGPGPDVCLVQARDTS